MNGRDITDALMEARADSVERRREAADDAANEFLCETDPLIEARSAVLFSGDTLDGVFGLVATRPVHDQMELRDDLVMLEARVHGIRRQLERNIREAS